jgi:hypothetical protein
MSWTRGIVPFVASLALAGCVDATIGETPTGPDAGIGPGGPGDDVNPEPDAGLPTSPDAAPDGGGGLGGGSGGGSGGETPDAGTLPDAGTESPDASLPGDGPRDFTLTHSLTTTIIQNNSVACVQQDTNGNTTGFLENRYYRVFDLTDARFDLHDEVVLEQVDVGVEVANAQNLELNLYALDGEFRFENLVPVALFNQVEIPAISAPSTLEVTFPRQTMQREEILVVEFVARDRFFIGSNQDGESDPSYIKAHDCSIDQPTRFAQVFSARPIHVVMSVHGETLPEPGVSFAPTAAGVVRVEVSDSPALFGPASASPALPSSAPGSGPRLGSSALR